MLAYDLGSVKDPRSKHLLKCFFYAISRILLETATQGPVVEGQPESLFLVTTLHVEYLDDQVYIQKWQGHTAYWLMQLLALCPCPD